MLLLCVGHTFSNEHSDLREQHDVRLEQGLDAFVVVDGLPIVDASNKAKLQKFVTGKLNTSAFKIKEDGFFMPLGESGKSEGCVPYILAEDRD